MVSWPGVLTVTHSALVNNTAGQFSGGGLFNSGDTVTLTNTTVSGNRARQNGGGLGNDNTMYLYNVTVANNTTDYDGNNDGNGGGVYASGTTATYAKNSLIGDNSDASSGGTVHPDCSGVVNSEGYSLLENSTGCTWGSAAGDVTGQDPKLGALADNGGNTWTHALSSSSPAMDAGTNTGCPTADQRGVNRPVDGDNNGTATCDMGAYEYQQTTQAVYLPLVLKNQ